MPNNTEPAVAHRRRSRPISWNFTHADKNFTLQGRLEREILRFVFYGISTSASIVESRLPAAAYTSSNFGMSPGGSREGVNTRILRFPPPKRFMDRAKSASKPWPLDRPCNARGNGLQADISYDRKKNVKKFNLQKRWIKNRMKSRSRSWITPWDGVNAVSSMRDERDGFNETFFNKNKK